MTPENFCYWLQGRIELLPGTLPTKEEWAMIAEHLQTVFVKTTKLENPMKSIDIDIDVYRKWEQPYTVTCSSLNNSNTI